jgi:drug/metabolite transporter (DMT)-like permease
MGAGAVPGRLGGALAVLGAAFGGGAVQLLFLVWATMLGLAIWGDAPTSALLLGSAIVVASGLYILWRETLRRGRPAVPRHS